MPKPKTRIGGKSPAQALKSELVRAPRPKIEEIGINFIREAGGPKAFARSIFTEFEQADVGSMARQRLLAIVFQSLKHIPDEYSLDTLEDMEDVDLQGILLHDLKLLNMIGEGDDPADGEQRAEGEQVGNEKGVREEAPEDQGSEGESSAGFPEGLFAGPAGGDEDGVTEEDEAADD